MNVKTSYWDLDRCAWVGHDPTTLAPPVRHADRPHDRDIAAAVLPEPRTASIPAAPESAEATTAPG